MLLRSGEIAVQNEKRQFPASRPWHPSTLMNSATSPLFSTHSIYSSPYTRYLDARA